MNNSILSSERFSTEDEILVEIMSSGHGYNSFSLFIGVGLTALFVLIGNKVDFANKSYFIHKIGRSGYIHYLTKSTVANSIFISFEFIIVLVILCNIFFNQETLENRHFYLSILLYFILLSLYFVLVGVVNSFFNTVFNSNKLSCILTISIFVLLVGMNEMANIYVSPIWFSQNFLKAWYECDSFNAFNYILDALKCVLSTIVIYFLNVAIFLRRDLIFNE